MRKDSVVSSERVVQLFFVFRFVYVFVQTSNNPLSNSTVQQVSDMVQNCVVLFLGGRGGKPEVRNKVYPMSLLLYFDCVQYYKMIVKLCLNGPSCEPLPRDPL